MSSNSGENAMVNTLGIRGYPDKCNCGRGVTIFTSKTQDNPGRPFFRCPTMKDEHLFKWVEDGIYEEVEDMLPKVEGLESDLENAKSEFMEWKAMTLELKEEQTRSRMEIEKMKRMMKFGIGFLCLIMIVIVVMIIAIKKKSHEQLVNRV